MLKPVPIILQIIAYAAFGVFIGYFSATPEYTHWNPEQALLKLSFSHAAQPIRECRRLTPEEIAALPPNMRRPVDCPRERLPLLIELEMDGQVLYRGVHEPTGLWSDGPATVYQKFAVPAGPHALVARLRDSNRAEGFDYEQSSEIVLQAQQNFVVDFRPNLGGFLFH